MNSVALTLYGLGALGGLAVFLAMPREAGSRRVPALLVGAAALSGFIVFVLNRYAGTTGTSVAYVILSALSIVGAVRVITHPRPVYSVLYFVLVALSSATLVLLVGAQFLWVAIVAVYAGAILVTYVFVIMLAQQPSEAARSTLGHPLDYDRQAREPLAAVLAGFLLIAVVSSTLVERTWPAARAAAAAATEDHTLEIGRILMTDHAVSLEVAGILLLIAMVGAIVLARRRIETEARVEPEASPADEIGRHVKPF